MMEGIGASRKVFEFMLRKPEEYQDGSESALPYGGIRFDSVTFAYPSRPNNNVLKVRFFRILFFIEIFLFYCSGFVFSIF